MQFLFVETDNDNVAIDVVFSSCLSLCQRGEAQDESGEHEVSIDSESLYFFARELCNDKDFGDLEFGELFFVGVAYERLQLVVKPANVSYNSRIECTFENMYCLS